jgi:predicted extracellular nuclease
MKKILIFALCLQLVGCSVIVPQIDQKISDTLQIHDIQGCSHQSPYLGRKVKNISGIVTWKDKQGFYFQGSNPDQTNCTSEAMYVFTKNYPDVIPGDKVEVDGKVEEYYQEGQSDSLSMTEIVASSVKMISEGNQSPDPVLIDSNNRQIPDKEIEDDSFSVFDPERDGIDYFESMEGMLVEIDNAVVVDAKNSYGEVVVIPESTVKNNILSRQGALLTNTGDQNPERITLILPDGWNKTVNLGAKFISPVIGIVTYQYSKYEIQVINKPALENAKMQIEKLPGEQSDQIRIATYNTENFSRFDYKKMKKLAGTIISELGSPDILILEEISDDSGEEDDGTVSARMTLEDLCAEVIDQKGPKYSFIDFPPENNSSGGQPGNNIRTIMLYRPDRGLVMSEVKLDSIIRETSEFNNSRLPSVIKFSKKNFSFYVIGVHLVSNLANSPEFGDIQPIEKPEESKRISQVNWIKELCKRIHSADPDSAIIVAGDFNDIPESKSLTVLENFGFTNLAESVPLAERYSIIFDGNAQLFDQILLYQDTKNSLMPDGAYLIHINTYQEKKKQFSDHDPLIVDIKSKTGWK